MNPRFPIYIPSKGRADSRLTVKALEKIGVPFRVVVEEKELEAYARVINKKKLLVLDPTFRSKYDTFDEHGLSRPTGSGPARNFIWEHSRTEGYERHWIVDDNINAFYRLNHNLKVPVSDGTIFRVMEDFVLRYSNVAMAGPNYFMFASRKSAKPPFVTNTRIYSCNLIRNDLPFRWRGRYNEDTDLSLRLLKAGFCTVLFNAFLQAKATTMTLKGGNTDTIYTEGTLEKSKMIVRMHPDVASLTWCFGRPHHVVDYRRFRATALKRNPGVKISSGVDNYGMKLKKVLATPND